MDRVLQSLELIERALQAELEQTPTYVVLQDVRRIIEKRRAMVTKQESKANLLGSITVHDNFSLHVWENEGGAVT